MNDVRITSAQRTAVAALGLPFILSDNDIARQFYSDGRARPRDTRDPMARVRGLATAAMNEVADRPSVAA